MSYDIDMAPPTALVPHTLQGSVQIEAKAEWGGFHAGINAGVTYVVERHGDMLQITGSKHGHFNAHYAFTLELPVDMIREAIGEK
jgi:hypothetical protein